MAKANYLIPGFQYRITSGLLAERDRHDRRQPPVPR